MGETTIIGVDGMGGPAAGGASFGVDLNHDDRCVTLDSIANLVPEHHLYLHHS